MAARTAHSAGMIFLVCLLGALIGTVLSKLLLLLLPALEGIFKPGVNLDLNLEVIRFQIRFNVGSVLGIAAALLVYRRL